MAFWLARPGDALNSSWIKRFDPAYWSVDFPRPMMAAVTSPGSASLRVVCSFYRHNDLAGLIWASEDVLDHPLLRYETSRDYRAVRLSFRWRSSGCLPLDAVNGPTLTIEGRDAANLPRTWYVRLWNYAVGTPNDAVINFDFDDLRSGFRLPDDRVDVWPRSIDRLFVSIVPLGYTGADAPLPVPVEAIVEIDDLVCDGSGSTIQIADTWLPAHPLRMSTAYDDSYNITPERMLRNIVQLGYRDTVNHYVGMSHYCRLRWNAVDRRFLASTELPTIDAAFRAWHLEYLTRAAALDMTVIQSLSYELFDANCPEAWKQRDFEGRPAATGWSPPSTLLSPNNPDAMRFLSQTVTALAGLAEAARTPFHFQVGEPWWWVGPDQRPCLYDASTTAAYVRETGRAVPARIETREQALTPAQRHYVEWAGETLARSTLQLRDAARSASPSCRTYILLYTPQIARAPDSVDRAINLPAGWAYPAFDVLQIEDYDFVIADDRGAHDRTVALLDARYAYPVDRRQYLAGFVLQPDDGTTWRRISDAITRTEADGFAAMFVWAYPQIVRDGFTYFVEEKQPVSFHDVVFPLALGLEARVSPTFSTDVVTMTGGQEQRNSRWRQPRLEFDAGVGVRSADDVTTLLRFFRARAGRTYAFRFRDPTDYSSSGMANVPSALDQRLGEGDGSRTRFALIKRYDTDDVRVITRPQVGTVRVGVNGAEVTNGWSLEAGGVVAFSSAPAVGDVVTAGYIYDVPVRFAQDSLDVMLPFAGAGAASSVPLIEVRDGDA